MTQARREICEIMDRTVPEHVKHLFYYRQIIGYATVVQWVASVLQKALSIVLLLYFL